MKEAGCLYLCATPIGNLQDISPRLAQTLGAVDIVAAEDTRRSLLLLNHLGLKARLVRYDEHTKVGQGAYLIQQLAAGKTVALLSDAGYPGLADPGEDLVKRCVQENIGVIPIPGPNAALCALVASGLPSTPFFFGGFLPKRKKHRLEQLAAWQSLAATTVLYEAPHRLPEVLEDILAVWGERPMSLARELTKVHEEFYRGTVTGAIALLKERPPRGEYCLVIGGPSPKDEKEKTEASSMSAAEKEARALLETEKLLDRGLTKKEALAEAAKICGLPKRQLYNAWEAQRARARSEEEESD